MSEAGQPLSRRERRALEQARAAEGEVTQALPVAPESLATLSRRERRRMERLARPMETWTAEEEMIATGQIPAMTPEAIAEQERIAREKAAHADAEARAAAAAWAATEPEPEPEPSPEPVVPDAVAEPAPEPQPETVVPDAVAEPAPEPAPAPAVNDIPEDLRHLFPPGSLQARAFEAQESAAQPAVQAPAADGPAAEAPGDDAADEIRRLTFEAMAGITRATTGAVPEVPAQPEPVDTTVPVDSTEPVDTTEPVPGEFLPQASALPEPAPEPAPEPVLADVPELPDGVDVEALWNAPTTDEPVRNPVATAPVTPFDDVLDEPVHLDEVPLVQDVPHTTEPTESGSEQAAPLWNSLVPATPALSRGTTATQFEDTAVLPVTEPAPSMWDTHPLVNPGASPVRELPVESPTQSLPRPDLSALLATPTGTSAGQAASNATEPTTSTGAMPARLAEPRAGGGARHFRWAHLAVIGAIAFVLGVLAWNIARSGS